MIIVFFCAFTIHKTEIVDVIWKSNENNFFRHIYGKTTPVSLKENCKLRNLQAMQSKAEFNENRK